jgi:hypothetical protein
VSKCAGCAINEGRTYTHLPPFPHLCLAEPEAPNLWARLYRELYLLPRCGGDAAFLVTSGQAFSVGVG